MKQKTLLFTALIFASSALGLTHTAKANSVNLKPNSRGTFNQWKPHPSNTSNYTEVRETSCDGDATFVSTSSNGAYDSYRLDISSIPDGSTITGAAILPCAAVSSTTGSPATLRLLFGYNGGFLAPRGNISISSTSYSLLAPVNFTSSFVKDFSTTVEIGEVGIANGNTLKLSRVVTQVYYNVPGIAGPNVLTLDN